MLQMVCNVDLAKFERVLQREEEEEDEYEVDDEMALALGFGGFGTSKR